MFPGQSYVQGKLMLHEKVELKKKKPLKPTKFQGEGWGGGGEGRERVGKKKTTTPSPQKRANNLICLEGT